MLKLFKTFLSNKHWNKYFNVNKMIALIFYTNCI